MNQKKEYRKPKKAYTKELIFNLFIAIIAITYISFVLISWDKSKTFDKVLAIIFTPILLWQIVQIFKMIKTRKNPYLVIEKDKIIVNLYSKKAINKKDITDVYLKAAGRNLMLFVQYNGLDKEERIVVANDKIFEGNIENLKKQIL